ncbi:MAG: MFS transporter [Cuniculiplasma sp.]
MSFAGINRRQWGQILSAFSGWLMDGYTSIAYVVVAVTISNVFFPSNFADSLLLTFLGLAVGALARLIGSLILGNFLGDRLGRRKMLLYSIMGFSVFSFLIAFIPTYKSVGFLATAILYALLFMVGLFAGAEYAGGTALSMESIPQEKRMPIGAFVQSGYGVGYFVMLLVAAAVRSYFGPAQNDDLVWRVIFASTIIPGFVALIIRFFSKESPVFEDMEVKKEIEEVPIEGMISQSRILLSTFLMVAGLLLINTVTLSFYPTFLGEIYPKLANTSLDDLYNSYINLVSLVGVWIGGVIAFFIFRRKMTLLAFSIIFLISLFPIYLLVYSGNLIDTLLAFSVQAFIEAAIFSTIPAFLSEVFSKTHRTTSIGFVYNGAAIPASFGISAVIFFSSAKLFGTTGTSWLAFLFIGTFLLLIGILYSKESANRANDPINK